MARMYRLVSPSLRVKVRLALPLPRSISSAPPDVPTQSAFFFRSTASART